MAASAPASVLDTLQGAAAAAEDIVAAAAYGVPVVEQEQGHTFSVVIHLDGCKNIISMASRRE